MSDSTLAAQVSRVRAYLHTPDGRHEMNRLGLAFGYSWPQALAQKVVWLCEVDRYEEITEIVEAVINEELAEKVA